MSVSSRAPRKRVLSLLCTAALVLGVSLVASSSSAADPGTLSGTVMLKTGGPGVGVAVDPFVYDADQDNWVQAARGRTDMNGAYALSLAPATYRVRIGAPRRGVPWSWYSVSGTAWSRWNADDVVVTSGATKTLNATVKRTAGITGTVHVPSWSGSPHTIRAVNNTTGRAYVQRAWEGFVFNPTGPPSPVTATYEMWGVEPGTYTVSFDRESGYGYNSAPQFYQGVAEGQGVSQATPVTVKDGEPTANVDAHLVAGGQVTAAFQANADDAEALSGYCSLSADTRDARLVERSGSASSTGMAGQLNGMISGLSTGDYQLTVWCRNRGPAYYDGDGTLSATPSTATFHATQGQATDLGLLTLPASTPNAGLPAISGKVTFPAGATLSAIDRRVRLVRLDLPGHHPTVDRTQASADGTFSFTNLEAGTYRVSFARYSGTAFTSAQFYDGKAEQEGKTASKQIVIPENSDAAVTGINATLKEGGHITGRLVDKTGQPMKFCRVTALTPRGKLIGRSTTSGADGTFDITGLATGGYHVILDQGRGSLDPINGWQDSDCGDGLRRVNAAKKAGPSTIAVPVNSTLGAKTNLGDVTYLGGASISGDVSLPADVSLGTLSGSDRRVRLYDASGTIVATTYLQGDENEMGETTRVFYEFTALKTGTYRVAFARGGANGKVLAGEFYKDVVETAGIDNATPIVLAEDEVKILDQVTLAEGGALAGVVKRPDGSVAERCHIEVFTATAPARRAQTWTSDEEGAFSIAGLSAGSYSLKVSECGYGQQWIQPGGALGFERPATDTTTVAAEADTTLALTLAGGGTITGKVNVPDGAKAWGTVDLTDADGNVVARRDYNADRDITFKGLAAGSYRLEFDRESGTNVVYRAGYQGNAADSARSVAPKITVSANAPVDAGTQDLVIGGTLTGKIIDDDGDAREDCEVRAFHESGLAERSASSRDDGAFKVRGLNPTGYRVAVVCWDDEYYVGSGQTLTQDFAKARLVAASATTVDLGTLTVGADDGTGGGGGGGGGGDGTGGDGTGGGGGGGGAGGGGVSPACVAAQGALSTATAVVGSAQLKVAKLNKKAKKLKKKGQKAKAAKLKKKQIKKAKKKVTQAVVSQGAAQAGVAAAC